MKCQLAAMWKHLSRNLGQGFVGPWQVLGITLGICAVSWVMCYAAFDGMLLAFPLVPAMDARHILATASLGATLMMTRSPASAVRLKLLMRA